MDLRHLRSFLAVSEELNITRAAQRLHLAQQAVSGHVQQLERAVGATLLVRTSRGVQLTAAGDELAAGAKDLVGGLDALADRVRRVAGGHAGRLRLVCKPHATHEFAVEVAEAAEAALPGLRADLADEPVVVPEIVVSDAVMRHWVAEPRPDGRPAPRGPRAQRIEDRLYLVARGRGVWPAPEPLSRYFLMPRVRWVPVTDAAPSPLALVWTERSPEALMAALAAQARAVTGWADAMACGG